MYSNGRISAPTQPHNLCRTTFSRKKNRLRSFVVYSTAKKYQDSRIQGTREDHAIKMQPIVQYYRNL